MRCYPPIKNRASIFDFQSITSLLKWIFVVSGWFSGTSANRVRNGWFRGTSAKRIRSGWFNATAKWVYGRRCDRSLWHWIGWIHRIGIIVTHSGIISRHNFVNM
jgi:hypothetical protein